MIVIQQDSEGEFIAKRTGKGKFNVSKKDIGRLLMVLVVMKDI